MMWGYGWSGPGMLMMSLSSLLGIILIAVLIWAVVRWFNRKNSTTMAPTPSAMEILHQRYARGDIDTVTFEQMQAQLEGRDQGPFAQSHEPVGGIR